MRRGALVVGLLLAGCGGGDGGGGGGGGSDFGTGLEIELLEQNGSGITGLSTLAPEGGGTRIVTEMIQPFDIDPQPIHVHAGTCADLDPKVAYPVQILEDGVGGSTMDVSLDELLEGTYAIEVHKSEKEPDVAVACGEIEQPAG